MRFLIVGAGGIGCYYGARLLQAGHQVSLVARGEHLQALQQQGLRLEHEQGGFQGAVSAVDIDTLLVQSACADFDLIILTLKSQATAGVMAQLGDWLKQADTPILSLQNGVDNESEISRWVGDARTLGGLAVRIGGHIIAPGVVHADGPAQVVMGAWPRQAEPLAGFLPALEQLFEQAAIPTRISSDIRKELWRKLIINNGVNPLSALTGLDTRSLSHDPCLGQSVYQMMNETALVARADQVELDRQDVEEMFTLIRNFDAIKTSMLVDKEKGRPLELDAISGAVLRRAERLGVATPVTRLVVGLLSLSQGASAVYEARPDKQ
ncbi:ketopantoate reductase family protein [Zobellella maritima]|uniref:ketopantoate reductase family protein n=1 Tax=Zobellella maritima TaxID=2059725 RepID=UPI000E3007EA|nr:2-dehydropantoate 2-reductase [Zobellella maritima]